MSLSGKWRIVEMPDLEAGYPDMIEPAYILFQENGSGEFAFGCVTGHFSDADIANATAADFSWNGNDEMEEARGTGWVVLHRHSQLNGEICFDHGDDHPFIARKWTSSTAC